MFNVRGSLKSDSADWLRSECGAAAGTVVAVILGIVVVIAAGAAAFALTAGKSAPSGNGFDPAAFKSAMDKAGIKAPALNAPVDASKVAFEGSKKLDAEFTDAELTAMLNAIIVQTSIPVTNLAVNMHAGSSAKATGEGQYKGKWYSGWIQGPISITAATLSSPGNTGYGVAGVPVPLKQYDAQATDFALSVMNAHLGIVSGLKIDKAETAEGKVKVTGTVPAKMVVND